MNYTELKDNIKNTYEFSFTDVQLDLFITQAEKAILTAVRVPSLVKGGSTALTPNSRFMVVPEDFVWPQSIQVKDATGTYHTLLNKDFTFLREAYPDDTVTGLPKFYGLLEDNNVVVAPVPDSAYETELWYMYFPESISKTTSGTSWIGDNFPEVLLNGSMVEAARFQKAEPDIVEFYMGLFTTSLQTMKNICEGKRNTDAYRTGV